MSICPRSPAAPAGLAATRLCLAAIGCALLPLRLAAADADAADSSRSASPVAAPVSSIVAASVGSGVFDVRRFGATGKKSDDARPAIQRAIDSAAAAGGGMVYVPPGDYVTGTLRLRSRVRLEIEAGATLFASPDPKAYEYDGVVSKAALFYGEELEGVTLGGRGTLDGQAEYEWRLDDFERAFDHKTHMQKLGKPLLRAFPKGFPARVVFPHAVWLGRSRDIQISGLNIARFPGWALAFYGCERLTFDRLGVYSSLKEGVWADGIDLDGCRDVSISNCSIETGDDCIVFISTDAWGPPRPCENITVSNCRLSSASAGVKFSEGNRLAIRKVAVSNTVFANVNRGIVFSIALGGLVEDVLLSNLVMDCRRFDWFWAGDGQPFHFRIKRLSEFNEEPPKAGEPPPGRIRNVLIRDVLAQAMGTSRIYGHPESPLEGITIENVRLTLSADPAAPFDLADHALHFRWATNLTVRGVNVAWRTPALPAWQSALCCQDVSGLEIDRFCGRGAGPDRAAVLLENVAGASLRDSRLWEDARLFARVAGQGSRAIVLRGIDLPEAALTFSAGVEVPTGAVRLLETR